ncbi:MAG: hypothetical protein QME90_18665 [Thermodesulfobacteriota bacterium]|nr:hypothetical protein [Thermodesulfobacteriota bacterium]
MQNVETQVAPIKALFFPLQGLERYQQATQSLISEAVAGVVQE